MGRSRRALLAAAACVVALGAMPAEARTYRALIVAAADYPALPKSAQLKGPKNDAALVRDYLTGSAPVKFAPENVEVLADIPGAAASPTHAAILAALKAMADKSERGDFVYLQFSGHGSQEPELKPGDEQDGLDEVFLPVDTQMFREKSEAIPNGLVDDEIQSALDAIRARGAFVWAVFDACHSGTATRAVGAEDPDETARRVDPVDLGIPQALLDKAAAGAASRGVGEEEGNRKNALGMTDASAPTSADATGKGGLVAFFAAQTDETTPEMKLPKGDPTAQKFGLFTFTILSRLAENPSMTYRQLAEGVLQSYSAQNRPKPTPLFEGDLDAPVFGSEVGQRVAQWPLKLTDTGASLPAGLLHRLTPGTKLAILPKPSSALKDALGYVEIRSARTLSSLAAPVAYDGKPALPLDQIPANAYARLAEVSVNLALSVARPPKSRFATETASVDKALDAIAADKDSGIAMKLVDAGQPADLTLAVMAEKDVRGARDGASGKPALWLLPPSAELSLTQGRRPPEIALDGRDQPGLTAAMTEDLLRISRATNLSRLAAASDFRPDEVGVEFLIRRAGSDALEPVQGGKVPLLHPDDEIHMRAKNSGDRPVDVNILYVGSNYKITPAIQPYRLNPGESFPETGLFAVGDATFGMERMIAILTEANEAQAAVQDLSFLAQNGVEPATREVGGAFGFAGMLREIGGAPAERDVRPLGAKAGPKGAVMIVPMETAPRP